MGFSLGGMFKGIGHTVGSIGKGIISVPGKVIQGGMGVATGILTMPGKILGGNTSGVFGGGIGTYVLLGVGAYLVIQLIK
jgi:hypothetical protein